MNTRLLHIQELVIKQLRGELTPPESVQLKEWIAEVPANAMFIKQLSLPSHLQGKLQLFHDCQMEDAWQRLLSHLDEHKIQRQPDIPRLHFLRKWGVAAASVLLVLTIGAYLWINHKKNPPHSTTAINAMKISPGKEGAILTLADGSQVLLDSVKNSVVALQNGVTTKVVNGELLYEGTGNRAVYNVMSTPKGRQYMLTLPDGTKVWLNAASSIRYPTVFMGSERRVEITGEAYLEVAKNKGMPFKLIADSKATIEVLGTAFNINAYDDEQSINTTLLQGSVRVVAVSSQTEAVLKPGQQAQIINNVKSINKNKNNLVHVINSTDVARAIAWKNGIFNFNDVKITEAMRQIARWYDVEVIYEKGELEGELFGKMDRQLTLQDLLSGLNGVAARFRLDGKKLYVSPR